MCGMTVDPTSAAGTTTYAGKEYSFCSNGCAHAFTADPGKYVREVGSQARS
ncbi:MAG: YHS domain-containing protein [Mycobacteriales bacterium]